MLSCRFLHLGKRWDTKILVNLVLKPISNFSFKFIQSLNLEQLNTTFCWFLKTKIILIIQFNDWFDCVTVVETYFWNCRYMSFEKPSCLLLDVHSSHLHISFLFTSFFVLLIFLFLYLINPLYTLILLTVSNKNRPIRIWNSVW